MFLVEKERGPDAGPSGAISEAQQRVLDVLLTRDHPATLTELAEITGLHENTLRHHLDTLQARGRVTRLRQQPQGRGRPAWTWLARPEAYAALAEALAAGLEHAGSTPAEAGAAGGRSWGERLVGQLGTDDLSDRERLMLALEHVGFEPETTEDGAVRLTCCPFVEAARAHPAAVCSVHRGLIEGALGTSLSPDALQPFAEPGACRVVLP